MKYKDLLKHREVSEGAEADVDKKIMYTDQTFEKMNSPNLLLRVVKG